MACTVFNSTCPQPGDTSPVLLAKILQAVNSGGGGGGAGVSAITINGGPAQTGIVALTIPQNTDELPEGSVNFYYTQARFNSSFAGKTTADLTENTNLYFTEARVLATVLTGFASALGAITAADSVLSAFGKTQGRLAALEAGTAGPFLLRAGDTGTGAFLFTTSVNDTIPLTLTSTAGSATTSNLFVANYGATNRVTLRNDGRLTLVGRASFSDQASGLGHVFSTADANTATSVLVASITHTLSAGVGANGIGAILDWNLDSSTTAATRAARWSTIWSDATHATRNAVTTLNAFVAGTETPQLVIGSNQIGGPVGTVALPSWVNRNDTTTGTWYPAASTMAWSLGAAEKMRLNTTGLGINITPTTELFVASTSASDPRGILTAQYSADTVGARLHFRKSRGASAGTDTVVQSGDTLGRIIFRGCDNAGNYIANGGASIRAVVTGTVAATRIATSLIFATATDAAPSVLTDRMVLTDSGAAGIGTATPNLLNGASHPGKVIHVLDSVQSAITLDTTAGGNSAIVFNDQSAGVNAKCFEIATGLGAGVLNIVSVTDAGTVLNNLMRFKSTGEMSVGAIVPTTGIWSYFYKATASAATRIVAENPTSSGWVNLEGRADVASFAIGATGSTSAAGGVFRPSGTFIDCVGVGGLNLVCESASGFITFTTDGFLTSVERMRISSGGLKIASGLPLCWSATTDSTGTADVCLRRDAAAVLALSNTTVAAQTFRVYETTDSGLANYGRLSFQTQAGNYLIRSEMAGTTLSGGSAGTPRILQVGTGPSNGTNIAGANVILHSGQPTGSGVPGAILFQQALPVGGSGSGVTALATIWSFDTTGNLLPAASNTYALGSAAARITTVFANNGFNLSNSGSLIFGTRGSVSASGDGIFGLLDNGGTAFTRLTFGGTTNSFNAIARDAVNGFTLQSAAATATWNDASTAAGGTVANRYLFGIAAPTLASSLATSPSHVTYTVASTVYIGGAPAASGFLDITTPYSLYVAGGLARFDDAIIAHGATAIPAGGTAGVGYRLSSTANFGVFFGSGAPSLAAAKGSLYLRSDGSGATDRAYINTDGGTTWTALTTVG